MHVVDYWFISYSSKDIKIVEQIVDVLKNCGISYWKAPEMIPADSMYVKEVPKAIKNCSKVLFVVSQASQNSVWVEKEIDSAINARKSIIPVRIDDVPVNDMYSFYMSGVQMIDVGVQADDRISKQGLDTLVLKFKENIPKQSIAREIQQETLSKQSIKNETVQESSRSNWAVNTMEKRDNTIIEETDAQKERERRSYELRMNTFRTNKIPLFCDKCKNSLEHVAVGTYRCPVCHAEYYDDFKKIRNYIRENGPAPAFIIERNTGVSKQAIKSFFNDDSAGIF